MFVNLFSEWTLNRQRLWFFKKVVKSIMRDHPFRTYAKFSEKLTRACAYQGLSNVSFSENFAYVQNGWSLKRILKTSIFPDHPENDIKFSCSKCCIMNVRFMKENMSRCKAKIVQYTNTYRSFSLTDILKEFSM